MKNNPNHFKPIIKTNGRWSLEWEWAGEGLEGDWDPDEPDDEPVLRANLYFDGKPLDDGSYCTAADTDSTDAELETYSQELFRALPSSPSGGYKREMQRWSWSTSRRMRHHGKFPSKTCPQCGASSTGGTYCPNGHGRIP